MPCYAPVSGFYAKDKNPNGKRNLVFKKEKSHSGIPVRIPCGRCIGCKLEKSRQWAMRCVHETQLHQDNIFVTLTYDEKHLPENGTLVPRHLQLFLKRLRKQTKLKLRFYASGEYGEEKNRPHYHAIIFGCDFNDKKLYKYGKHGDPVYTSATLHKIWTAGQATIGQVTFESAAYVARYTTKKITGDKAEPHYNGRHPEFGRMSRRPGIGAEWFKKYGEQTYKHDNVIMRGQKVRPPKYYDKELEKLDNKRLLELKKKRTRAAIKFLKEQTPERRRVRETVAEARLQMKGNTL